MHPWGCEWSVSDDPHAVEAFVIDVERSRSDGDVLPCIADNTLIRSLDGGSSWDRVSVPRACEPRVLLERVALPPTEPLRVCVTGAAPRQTDFPVRRAYFFRSDDGGESFEELELPLEGEERNGHVLAVDHSARASGAASSSPRLDPIALATSTRAWATSVRSSASSTSSSRIARAASSHSRRLPSPAP